MSAPGTASGALPALTDQECAAVHALDRRLNAIAVSTGAREFYAPPLVTMENLDKVNYFNAFPHHIGIVAPLHPAAQTKLSEDTEGQTEIPTAAELSDPTHAFTPAACYLLYPTRANMQLEEDEVWTLMSNCCRNEREYNAGQRQQVFRMREIVFIGTADGAKEFQTAWRTRMEELLEKIGLPCEIQVASDPFFRDDDPRRMMQKMQQVKFEVVWRGELAIASMNFHTNFFGDSFDIKDKNGESAFTACTAFGLERWHHACREEFGPSWTEKMGLNLHAD